MVPAGAGTADCGRPDLFALSDAAGRDGSLTDIEGIVDAFALLYRQPERIWSFELDMRTSKEKW
ncbi:hypothetical protein JQ607_07985 [Bradyrhizobium liaoningense]|uniref:hypothetical protein n=1 Tax=Bradyrhizobium liaoningense TaxID=43992 RepID=UPI001BABE30E|nr:hypothetical protein [Bradyrhizobium liaoningense]MBR0840133.1 hypothetical protein [Bradyrhizobium liaoningense]